ncbi:hypothetical protein PGT21_009264 [Puccinia graminis f. sp. tritici]|uniref:Ecp2 effector protein domain-containing protein n=2 Tax=Puccinia graminis f. sp. tritici TaxID=56615 RepID=E3KW58_PUCGT|nr:uncharacterized protein PGTG_14111 [Puccinia graminis f. sp. tritici CRL 75-36-700-3]EFP88533.2 hypothetical protein PGTG_14111 [Puccinia graminis f. sp. tritici CRL 75-36-700-3]KAA1101157.1 hypothetical protein PGT21_009264 [Puccinia graminis f. sp. tritici]
MSVYKFLMISVGLLSYSPLSAAKSCYHALVDVNQCTDAASKIPYSGDDKSMMFTSDKPENVQSGRCSVTVVRETLTDTSAVAPKADIDAAIQTILGCAQHSGMTEVSTKGSSILVTIHAA